MRDSWWRNWHWGRIFSEFLSPANHHSTTASHSSTIALLTRQHIITSSVSEGFISDPALGWPYSQFKTAVKHIRSIFFAYFSYFEKIE
jgi:hypothetical protein